MAYLLALPTKTFTADNRYLPGLNTLTIIPLKEPWAVLPRRPTSDTLLAGCARWLRLGLCGRPFIEKYHPFIVIAINGKPLDKILDQGVAFDGGLYIIDVSESIALGVSTCLDIGTKSLEG